MVRVFVQKSHNPRLQQALHKRESTHINQLLCENLQHNEQMHRTQSGLEEKRVQHNINAAITIETVATKAESTNFAISASSPSSAHVPERLFGLHALSNSLWNFGLRCRVSWIRTNIVYLFISSAFTGRKVFAAPPQLGVQCCATEEMSPVCSNAKR